jgi:hypothetical protein
METSEAWRQHVRREQQLIARLRLATTRLADADRERIWAIVAAKEAGLSIRQTASATGLSPTRVHQLLKADEAREIPMWLSQLHDDGLSHHAADREADPPAAPVRTLKSWQQVRRSFGLDIASGSRSLSHSRDGSVSGKSARPYGKRRGSHRMRDAQGRRYSPVH